MRELLEGKSACLFDMDGTLIDSESIWQEAIQIALEQKGVHLSKDEVVRLEYGKAWNEIFDEIHSRWPDAYATRLDMEAFTVPYYRHITATRDISIPGSVEALRKFHELGYSIAIASGSTRERIGDTIATLGIEKCVSCYVGGGDYARGKPEPDCFLAAAALLGVNASECVVFEDAETGVLAAKKAGMACVALDNGQGKDLSLADCIVKNLLDMLDFS